MKNIKLILAICFITYSCKAQTIVINNEYASNIDIPDNAYIKDINNNHDAVVGTWLWDDGQGNSFELVIEEREMYLYPQDPTNILWDDLYGKYRFVENGIEKVNVLYVNYEPYLAPFAMTLRTPIKYGVIINDLSTNKSFQGKFFLDSPTEARMELRMSEGLKFADPNLPNLPFSIPTSMVLIKQ